MTNENYTNMSNEELLEEVKKVVSPINQLGRNTRRKLPELFNEIMSRTSFLEDPNIPFTARLHCLEHNFTEQPKCKMCDNPVECMIAHGVIILRESDVKGLSWSTFQVV